MIFDGLMQFTGTAGIPGSTDSPTTGAQFSTNTIALDPGARDLGIGDDSSVKLSATVSTAFTGGSSLQVNIQGSVDNSAWTTMLTGPMIAEANLLVGVHLCDVDLPRIAGALVNGPGGSQALPRFLRLQYVSGGLTARGHYSQVSSSTGTTTSTIIQAATQPYFRPVPKSAVRGPVMGECTDTRRPTAQLRYQT